MNIDSPYVVGGSALILSGAALYYLYQQKKSHDQKVVPVQFLQAAKDGKVDLIISLAQSLRGVDAPTTADDGENALHLAIRYNHPAAFNELIKLGASLTAVNIHNFGPLHLACYYGADVEIIETILKHKPNLEAVDQNGWTALHVATSKNNMDLIKRLIEAGSLLDATTAAGESPLLICANNGFVEGVNYFLSKRANPMVRRVKTMDSPLILATWNGHVEIVKILLAAEPQLLVLPMSDGTVPLHVAAAVGNIPLLQMFLDEYACDINVKKRDGFNCLHIAVNSDKPNAILVRTLITRGCHMTAKDRFGCTPLHRACMRKNLEFVKMFLEAGCEPHVTDNDGLTPMHSLCSNTNKEKEQNTDDQIMITILKEFVFHGADITVTDRVGANILHYAVSRTTNIPLIKFIIEQKPGLAFAVDRSDRTPLHLVCKMYKNPTIEKLLRDHMEEVDPDFFKTFDPNHRIEYDKNVILSQLSEGERFSVLNGDVSLNGIAAKIKSGQIKNVIVLTGAGISTSAGIPDFRGEKGIYKDKALGDKYGQPTSTMFSFTTLMSNPDRFYKVLKDVFLPVVNGKFKPTASHRFIVDLEKRGILLRNFTQNVDTLELKAGLSPEKLVEAHGSFARVKCNSCGTCTSETEDFWKDIENDQVPICRKCSTGDKKNVLQPDIVLFGQSLPSSFYDGQDDFGKCDLLIVMGTSLQVYPFASLVSAVSEKTPRLLFNLEAVGPFTNGAKMRFSQEDGKETLTKTDPGYPGTFRDVAVLGDIDKGVTHFLDLINNTD